MRQSQIAIAGNRHGRILLVIVVLVAFVAGISQATGTASGREATYQINSRGFRVGEMKTTSQPLARDGRRLILFRSTTTIDAKFLFFSKQSISHDEALVSDKGPIEYRHDRREKGVTHEVEARFTDTQVRLEIREEGRSRTVVIPKDRYDYTTMDCAEMSLAKEGDRKEIRLLNLETGRIVTRKYAWRMSEEISVSGKKVLCRVIDFEDQDNQCRRWVTKDEKGILIARQEGKGDAGSYVLKIATLVESL